MVISSFAYWAMHATEVDSGANCDASAPRPDWMEVLVAPSVAAARLTMLDASYFQERRYGKSLEEAP